MVGSRAVSSFAREIALLREITRVLRDDGRPVALIARPADNDGDERACSLALQARRCSVSVSIDVLRSLALQARQRPARRCFVTSPRLRVSRVAPSRRCFISTSSRLPVHVSRVPPRSVDRRRDERNTVRVSVCASLAPRGYGHVASLAPRGRTHPD